MRIGLIDADLLWGEHASGRRYGNTKADIFPNLVLMKLSAYHKQMGDEVSMYYGVEEYDRVYISKVFSTTPISRQVIFAKEIYFGGTGFCINLIDGKEVYQHPEVNPFTGQKMKDCTVVGMGYQAYEETGIQTFIYCSELPKGIEHIMPDYSIYPSIKDTAYGFLTRGCPRGCHFCHVEAKEGRRSYKVADLSEWWNGQKNIVLCDPNILACRQWKDLLQQLADSKAKVDINQGMDARLLTPEKVEMLNKIRLSTIHFAWDDYKQKDKVLKGLQCFADHFRRKLDKGHWAQVFVLTNYDTTPEQDLERIYTLRDMGFEPYVMVYDKPHAGPFYKSLQRWVNMRAIFHRIRTFEEHDRVKAKE